MWLNHSFLRISSHLLKKFLMENNICIVYVITINLIFSQKIVLFRILCVWPNFCLLNLNLMVERDESRWKLGYFYVSVWFNIFANCGKYSITNGILGMWHSLWCSKSNHFWKFIPLGNFDNNIILTFGKSFVLCRFMHIYFFFILKSTFQKVKISTYWWVSAIFFKCFVQILS